MVDERDAASGAASPLAASATAGERAEAPNVESPAGIDGGEFGRRRDASTELATGSGAPLPPGGAGSSAPASLSAASAADSARERLLKAGSRQARICEPLWKVRCSAMPTEDPPVAASDLCTRAAAALCGCTARVWRGRASASSAAKVAAFYVDRLLGTPAGS